MMETVRKTFWIVTAFITLMACLLVSSGQASAATSHYFREAPAKKSVSKVPYFGYDVYEIKQTLIGATDDGKKVYQTDTLYWGKMYDYASSDQRFFKKKIRAVFTGDIAYYYYPNGVTVKHDGKKRWIFYKGSTTFSRAIF